MTDMEFFHNWGHPVWTDFVTLFCGEFMGKGVARYVWALRTDPTKVVKIEMASRSFQNTLEWMTWLDLQDTHAAKYLAPCYYISQSGICLIQHRTEPLRPEHEDVLLPEWLGDFKRSNYGVIDGRVVARDYGSTPLLNHGAFGAKRRKPKWWD